MKNAMKRREFLNTSAVATAATPTIVPASVLGGNAPSNRVAVGAIGAGSRANSNIRQLLNQTDAKIVAACDPNRRNLENIGRVANLPSDNL